MSIARLSPNPAVVLQATWLLAAGVAVRVTVVPWSKLAEQVAPQAMPAGEESTAPAPLPARVTVSG